MTAGRFPVAVPAGVTDARFTLGLSLDIANVLAKHGYPDMTSTYDGQGLDLVDLQLALFRFLYTTTEETR